MYPWVWPGCLCCVKPPAVFKCSNIEGDSLKTTSYVKDIWRRIQPNLNTSHRFKNTSRCTAQWQNVIVCWAWSCQEKLERSVRIVIFDFLSPLNTLQPLLLGQKLRAIQPDNAKVSWIIDYLRDRPQFVPSWGTILDLQKGTVAVTFLIHSLSLTQLWVTPPPDFSDDSSIMVCIHKREGEAYCISLLRRSVWCQGGPSEAEHLQNGIRLTQRIADDWQCNDICHPRVITLKCAINTSNGSLLGQSNIR